MYVRRLLAGVLVLVLTGCAHQQAGDGGAKRVAYLGSMMNAPFSVQMSAGYRFGAGQFTDVTATVTGPPAADATALATTLTDLTTQGYRSIAISIPFTETTGDPLGDAVAKGVHLIAFDTPPVTGSPVLTYIGNDNQNLGRLLADTVADRLDADATGRIVLGNPRNGVPQLDARALGFTQRMRERLPKVRVLGPLDTADRPGAATSMWESVTESTPGALAFVSVGADGRLLSEIRARRKASWVAAAFDVDDTTIAAVKRDELVLVSPEQFLKGAVAAELQVTYLGRESEMPEGWLEIPGVAVTAANAGEILARDATDASRRAYYLPAIGEVLAAATRPLEDAQ
ncbi:substrate-binding domain-containing protein [Actinoplanes sp. NPDC051851]|uniref:sugar ABC transporter substrate-binding protein n=1 Tax=Actinoplanes sp. NPDC051851 TaxID=3154753 RepID=UPI0034141FF2